MKTLILVALAIGLAVVTGNAQPKALGAVTATTVCDTYSNVNSSFGGNGNKISDNINARIESLTSTGAQVVDVKLTQSQTATSGDIWVTSLVCAVIYYRQ